MENQKLNEKNALEIVKQFEPLRQVAEGKKPIKPEFVLYLIDQLQKFSEDLNGASEIITTFKTDYEGLLKAQIEHNKATTKSLEKNAKDVSNKLTKVMDLESRIENISEREKQVNQTLDLLKSSLTEINKVDGVVKDLKITNNLVAETSKNATAKIDESSNSINSQLNELSEQLKYVNEEKVIFEKTKSGWENKKEELQSLLIEREQKIQKQQAEFEKMEHGIKIKEDVYEKHSALLDARNKSLDEKEGQLLELMKAINQSQMDSKGLLDELDSNQKKLNTDIAKNTALLSEKTYLYKLEEDLKEKQKEISVESARLTKEKELLYNQMINFSGLVDKTSNNLDINQVTTENLGNVSTSLSNNMSLFSTLLSDLGSDRRILGDELKAYQKVRGLLHDNVNEFSKQISEMLKLNVLSTYIQQTILEMREAEMKLKIQVETLNAVAEENSITNKNMDKFLITAEELLKSTKSSIEFYVDSEDKMKKIRSDLLTSQFKLKELEAEMETAEKQKVAQEEYLEKLDKQVMELEGSVVKKRLTKSMENKDSDHSSTQDNPSTLVNQDKKEHTAKKQKNLKNKT